ncbi:MAG: hypothetical protein MI924_38640 [Chloroflexales bacterium]|nr:hypothetical protein [Chloroflexales bacterium]
MCPDPDAQYADLLQCLGDCLNHEARCVLQRYLIAAPTHFRKHLRQGAALTFRHPDNIATNFLFPRQPGAPVYLIDWQVYRRGPLDLAALLTRSSPAASELRDRLAAPLSYASAEVRRDELLLGSVPARVPLGSD